MHLRLTWSDGSTSTIYVRKYRFDKAAQQVHVQFDDMSWDVCEVVIAVEETGPSVAHRLYADHVRKGTILDSTGVVAEDCMPSTPAPLVKLVGTL